jgi:hypothetical protein
MLPAIALVRPSRSRHRASASSNNPINPRNKPLKPDGATKFITPIPKPKKRKATTQTGFVFDEGKGLCRRHTF